jgi:hypothetical protein
LDNVNERHRPVTSSHSAQAARHTRARGGENCDCDVYGVSLHGNFVDEAGLGISVSLFTITNGQDRGIYAAYQPSGRAGVENSASFGVFKGSYVGDEKYPSLNDFLGNSLDGGTNSMNGVYGWGSFKSNLQPTWYGTGKSFGIFGGGASFGYGYTKLIYGFEY